MQKTRRKLSESSSKESESVRKVHPRTREEWEDHCISLSFRAFEERLLNGTASAQEITHFLRLGSTKERLEREMMETQNELMAAKRDQIHSQAEMKGLLEDAMKAFTVYSGGES